MLGNAPRARAVNRTAAQAIPPRLHTVLAGAGAKRHRKQTKLMNTLTTSRLAVRFGRSRNVATVSSIKEASEVWERLRDEQCLGASESPKVSVVDITTGKTVAHISYNGRAWGKNGEEIAL